MGKSFEDKLAELSPARRRKVEARTAALIAEEQSLRDLRRASEAPRLEQTKALAEPYPTPSPADDP